MGSAYPDAILVTVMSQFWRAQMMRSDKLLISSSWPYS